MHRLKLFYKKYRLPFKRFENLQIALTHKSKLSKEVSFSNERLEFLGDSVLGLLISEYLYIHYSDKTEGFLAKVKSYVVSRHSLYKVAEIWDIQEYLDSIYTLSVSSTKNKKRILANAVEAIIGALYIDRGYKVVKKVIMPYFVSYVQEVVNGDHARDYKSILQVYVQKMYKSVPQYMCVDTRKKGHEPEFKVQLQFNYENNVYTSVACWNTNKKKAEQMVAKYVCNDLRIDLSNELSL